MTQVLDEFEQLLEESFAKSNSVADIVEGTVIKKESEGYLISVKGAKMEAFLSNKELSSDIEELEIGEVREFYVLKEENNEDSMLLSLKRIAFAQAWAQLNDAKIQVLRIFKHSFTSSDKLGYVDFMTFIVYSVSCKGILREDIALSNISTSTGLGFALLLSIGDSTNLVNT